MDIATYYSFQAVARGLHTLDDVQEIVAANKRLYDTVVLPWLPADRKAAIYEVACGPGIFLHWLKSQGYTNASGSDSSDVQIALARVGQLDAELADSIGKLRGFAAESLDCIVGLDFYEHLPKEVLLDFLFESFRVIKPGGRLILKGPNGDSPVLGRALYNDITHVTALTSIAFHALLTMAGFKRTAFADDTLASIQKQRLVRVPLAWIAQRLLRTLIRFATRENIQCLSASFLLCAWK